MTTYGYDNPNAPPYGRHGSYWVTNADLQLEWCPPPNSRFPEARARQEQEEFERRNVARRTAEDRAVYRSRYRKDVLNPNSDIHIARGSIPAKYPIVARTDYSNGKYTLNGNLDWRVMQTKSGLRYITFSILYHDGYEQYGRNWREQWEHMARVWEDEIPAILEMDKTTFFSEVEWAHYCTRDIWTHPFRLQVFSLLEMFLEKYGSKANQKPGLSRMISLTW